MSHYDCGDSTREPEGPGAVVVPLGSSNFSIFCDRELRKPSAELIICEFEDEDLLHSCEVQSAREKFHDTA